MQYIGSLNENATMTKNANVFDGSNGFADALARGTSDELLDRRQQVLRLRLRRLPQRAIAAIVGVDQGTVSRDLHWIRVTWRSEYGVPATVSPAEEIGMAVALYADAEHCALLEYHSLKDSALNRKMSPMFTARQRMACLRTAMVARQMRVSLLRDLGFLERSAENAGLTFRADAVRRALREEGLLPGDTCSLHPTIEDAGAQPPRTRARPGEPLVSNP